MERVAARAEDAEHVVQSSEHMVYGSVDNASAKLHPH